MNRPSLLLLLTAALLALGACGDSDQDDDGNNAANNDAPNNDVNNDVNNDTPNNETPNNDVNNDVDPVAACEAACTTLGTQCRDTFLAAACPEEAVEQLIPGCQQACQDEDARAQITAVAGLPCETVVPLAIDGFGLSDVCQEVAGFDPEAEIVGVTWGSDFATGSEVLIFSLDGQTYAAESLLETESTDTTARALAPGEFVVLERDLNRLTHITLAGQDQRTSITLPEGFNPQDIVKMGERFVLTGLGSANALILGADLQTLDEVDLSGVNPDDTDGIPEAAQVFDLGGGRAGVLLQNLLNFASVGSSYLAIIDVEAGQLTGSVELPGGNPYVAAQEEGPGGPLLVALIEDFGDTRGQIITVDTDALTLAGGLITEEAVGGDINGFATTDAGFLISATTPEFTTRLVHITENGPEVILDTPGFDLGTVTRRGDRILVTTAQTDGPGIIVFDAANISAQDALGPLPASELPARGLSLVR